MTESGHAAQVVKVTENHGYELDEHVLETILLSDEIKDLPVVVVSVAGAYRGGKSFLLNFFLRYLASPPPDREDGSWLGEESEPLIGFKWQSGIRRTTRGVLLWSEPFVITLPNGNKVAVLLMDTQGTFDNTSTVRDCTTIFALSALLSSVQIFNVFGNIQEDDLQNLQLFTEYGKLVKNQGSTAFQVLEFLVRDWPYPEDYPYGAEGGEMFLQERLQITPNLHKDMKELRQHITSSFEKISCFLMPHPGFKVLKLSFRGQISDIGVEFRTHLVDLVKSLFSPEKLVPKTINGVQIKARDLHNYFKTYVKLLNSDTIPSPMSIMNATVEAGFLSTLNEAREVYETGMNADCGPKQPSVPAGDLKVLHMRHKSKAIQNFLATKKMGSEKEAYKYLTKLKEELEQRASQFGQSNLAKTQTAINNANEAYDNAVQNITKDQPLCVHPLDLEKVHEVGFKAALSFFDRARKRVTDVTDDERLQFIKSFEKRHTLLRLSNEQNNKMTVSMLANDYWNYMQEKNTPETPLSEDQFKEEHDKAKKKILEEFDSKRNISSIYTEDVYKFNLTKIINENFIQLKAMSESMNKAAMQSAVFEYDSYMRNVLDTRKNCMHPSGLERENQNGLCRALVKFRPKKQCSDGFDNNDKDEKTLSEILKQRYADMESLNNSANEAAVQKAYNVYVSMMDELCRPSLQWALIIPMIIDMSKRIQFHETSKAKAYEVFNGKRGGGSFQYSSDTYKDYLDQMMETYYRRTSSKYDDLMQKIIGGAVKVGLMLAAGGI